MGTINRGVVWVDGQFLTAADLNSEFNIVHDEFNGNIDDANVKAAAAIAGTKIAPDFGQQSVTLQELGADPNALTDKGRIYTKDVSGGTELFYRDAAGNVVQVTSGGVLSSAIVILPGYIHGLGLANNGVSPASVIDVDVGACEVTESGGSNPEVLSLSSALDINLAASGAGGLDAGSPGINWYHAYIIYDPTGPTIEAMCSLSATNPSLPGGYTKFRRIGTFYNTASGSASIRQFIQTGKGSIRKYQYVAESTGGINVGTGLSQQLSLTSLSIATASPTTADSAFGTIGLSDGTNLTAELSSNSSNPVLIFSGTGGDLQNSFKSTRYWELVLEAAQTIYYINSHSSDDIRINVSGYGESI